MRCKKRLDNYQSSIFLCRQDCRYKKNDLHSRFRVTGSTVHVRRSTTLDNQHVKDVYCENRFSAFSESALLFVQAR